MESELNGTACHRHTAPVWGADFIHPQTPNIT